MAEDTYQLPEELTVVGFEIEQTKDVDPADTRQPWPGAVMNEVGPLNDKNFEFFRPVGVNSPYPHFAVSKSRRVELEVESQLAVPFSTYGANEPISLGFGTIDPVTGAVTLKRPHRSMVVEWGRVDRDLHVDLVTVVGGEGTYDITVLGTLFQHVTSGAETATIIRDALVVAINGGPINITAAPVSTDQLTITSTTIPGGGIDLEGVPLDTVVLYTASGGGGGVISFTTTSGGKSWIHKLVGCKFKTIQWTFRTEEVIMMKVTIIGKILTTSTSETFCTTTPLSGLPEPPVDCAIWSDGGFSFKSIPGDVELAAEVVEFDLIYENNMLRRYADTQTNDPRFLIEQFHDLTFTMKIVKEDNDLYDIADSDPTTGPGQVKVEIIVDQPDGWFMKITLPVCILSAPDHSVDKDTSHVEETLAGTLVGPPILDMNKLV